MSIVFIPFDPYSYGYLPLKWIRLIIPLGLFLNRYWTSNSKLTFRFKILIIKLKSDFITPLGNHYKSVSLIFVALFFFLVLRNFNTLPSYRFSHTRHIAVTLSLALPIWLRFILYGWINKCNDMFAHLLPVGTPSVLIAFIVVIETVRNLSRPISLAIRLIANIISGHLLLVLFRAVTYELISHRGLGGIVCIIVVMAITLLELGVAVIQAYVFSVLCSLYSGEVIRDH